MDEWLYNESFSLLGVRAKVLTAQGELLCPAPVHQLHHDTTPTVTFPTFMKMLVAIHCDIPQARYIDK
jgi:hypothetical protein